MQTATLPATGAAEALPAEFLTVRDLSEFIDKASQTLANWRLAGTGPAFSVVGNRILYARADVLSWLLARRATSTADAQARGLLHVPANKKVAVAPRNS